MWWVSVASLGQLMDIHDDEDKSSHWHAALRQGVIDAIDRLNERVDECMADQAELRKKVEELQKFRTDVRIEMAKVNLKLWFIGIVAGLLSSSFATWFINRFTD